MGMYIILADDTEEGYETDSDWEPELYDYQVQAGNVLFFTFVNPETMIVPNAYAKLMATKGSGAKGSIPDDTSEFFLIILMNPFHLYCASHSSCALCNWRLCIQHWGQPMALVDLQGGCRGYG